MMALRLGDLGGCKTALRILGESIGLSSSGLGSEGVDGDSAEPAPTLGWSLAFPIASAPVDPLAGSANESCAVFMQQRCVDNTQARCDIYDPTVSDFVDQPDTLLRRALLFDRWYDLYGSPDGQTAERRLNQSLPKDASEEEWGQDEVFFGYDGLGDSAIWTGTALNALILRYLQTGTDADYQRMEDKVRVMLGFFDVTGMPGYVARHHYLEVPPGMPANTNHVLRSSDGVFNHVNHHKIQSPESIEVLPPAYTEGIGDGDGDTVVGTPRWSGAPTIDQMNGPMVAFPLAYG